MLENILNLTDHQLIDGIRDSHRNLTRHKARFLIGLGEFDSRGLSRSQGASTGAAWLSRTCGISQRSAYEYLRMGGKLRNFPLLARHFSAGELSYSKVRLLLRYLHEGNEPELVELALELTYEGLEQELAGRPRANRSGSNPPEYFKLATCEDTGDLKFWGRLSPDRGAELLAALKIGELASLRDLANLPVERLNDSEAIDGLIDAAQDTVEAVPAEQLVPGVVPRRPENAGPTGDTAESEPRRPTRFGPPMKRSILQALLAVIAMVRSTPRSKVRAPGAEVNVSVGLDGNTTLVGHVGAETRQLHRLLLNSDVVLHVEDEKGVKLMLGRKARTVSQAQAKALWVQWGGQCGTPGCVHMMFLEFHHIRGWSEGGGTDMDNLIPLCASCHAMVTAGLLSITVNEENPSLLVFRFPDGSVYISSCRGTPQRSDAAVVHGRGQLVTGDSFADDAINTG